MTTTAEHHNIFADAEWHREMGEGHFHIRGRGIVSQLTKLGGTLYELQPGKTNMPYHAHHAMDELIIVLAGTPTVRTPDGERELVAGDVVECPAGAAGAHQMINRSEHAARFLIMSSQPDVDVVEYPDSNKLAASSGAWGTPTFQRWLLDAGATKEYFDGETG